MGEKERRVREEERGEWKTEMTEGSCNDMKDNSVQMITDVIHLDVQRSCQSHGKNE